MGLTTAPLYSKLLILVGMIQKLTNVYKQWQDGAITKPECYNYMVLIVNDFKRTITLGEIEEYNSGVSHDYQITVKYNKRKVV